MLHAELEAISSLFGVLLRLSVLANFSFTSWGISVYADSN
jgi:hypothetical protein